MDNNSRLLKKLVEVSLQGKEGNLVSGFKSCGIYPLDASEVLKRLPGGDGFVDIEAVGEAFLETVISKRAEATPSTRKKRKLVNVEPGKGITPTDFDVPEVASENKQKKRKRGRPMTYDITSDEESDLSIDGAISDDLECESENSFFHELSTKKVDDSWKEELKENVYVAVDYSGQLYPGRILGFTTEDGVKKVKVMCMEKTMKFWKWPVEGKEDLMVYDFADIKMRLNEPTPIRRGYYSVPQLNSFTYE